MKKLITTEDLKRATGLSYPTLKEYVRLGLIDPPLLRSFGPGGGRGSCGWWKTAVLFDLGLIKALKKLGHKNTELKKILKGESP
ncbi:MerR family transcriptional regulator [candidate division KSB1 bacterium]|nr:MerR family transcriptional regulator [candidate division KSB1 bacterium]